MVKIRVNGTKPWKPSIASTWRTGSLSGQLMRCQSVRRAHKRENDAGNVTVMWTSSDGEWPAAALPGFWLTAYVRGARGRDFLPSPNRGNAMHVRTPAPAGLWCCAVRRHGDTCGSSENRLDHRLCVARVLLDSEGWKLRNGCLIDRPIIGDELLRAVATRLTDSSCSADDPTQPRRPSGFPLLRRVLFDQQPAADSALAFAPCVTLIFLHFYSRLVTVFSFDQYGRLSATCRIPSCSRVSKDKF
jgi:hypothetical protein